VFQLRLARYSTEPQSTLGVVTAKIYPGRWSFLAYTLEDGHNEPKIPGRTRIPAGVYPLGLRREGGLHARYQSRFPEFHRGMIWIREIPGYEWVYFHIGNTHEDTEGCPLVGSSPASFLEREQRVVQSTHAYRRFYPIVAAAIGAHPNNSTLTVVDDV